MTTTAGQLLIVGMVTGTIGTATEESPAGAEIQFDDGSTVRFIPHTGSDSAVFSRSEPMESAPISGLIRQGRLHRRASGRTEEADELREGVQLPVFAGSEAGVATSYDVEFDLTIGGQNIDCVTARILVPNESGVVDLSDLVADTHLGLMRNEDAFGPAVQSISVLNGAINFTIAEAPTSATTVFPILGGAGRVLPSKLDAHDTRPATVTYPDGSTKELPFHTDALSTPGEGVLAISNPSGAVEPASGAVEAIEPRAARSDAVAPTPLAGNRAVPETSIGSSTVSEVGRDLALAPIVAPTGLDANAVDMNVSYTISAATQALNLPISAAPSGELRTIVIVPTSFRPKLQSFFTMTTAQLWSRFSGPSGWSEWKRVDAGAATTHMAVPAVDLNRAVEGSVVSFSSSTAHAPVHGTGTVHTYAIYASTNLQQTAFVYGSDPQIWMRFAGGGFWGRWKRMDIGALGPTAAISAPAPSPAGFKTVPLALTVGGGPSHRSGTTTGGVRIPIRYGARLGRFKVHLRNINPRVGVPGTGTVTVPKVWVSRHAGNGLPDADSTLIAQDLSSAGTDMATPWVSVPLDADTDYLLIFQWRATQPTLTVPGGGWATRDMHEAISTTARATRTTTLPLDVWIEAEVEPDVPVIAAFGDSLSSGVGASLPVFDSWLSQYCRAMKALPVHYTASGDTMKGWESSSHYKWTRWQHLTRSDAVVHAMGSNDIFGGTDLATIKERRLRTMNQLRALVSPVIHTMTILPRNHAPAETEAVRRAYNTWLMTKPDGARDLFDITSAASLDNTTLVGSFDADGTHLTKEGYAAMAGSITRPLARYARLETPPTADEMFGWRDATDLLENGWSADAFLIRRTATEIQVMFKRLSGTDATGDLVMHLPEGWTPYVPGSYPSDAIVRPVRALDGSIDWMHINSGDGSVTYPSRGTSTAGKSWNSLSIPASPRC